jgi:hypothetical protein
LFKLARIALPGTFLGLSPDGRVAFSRADREPGGASIVEWDVASQVVTRSHSATWFDCWFLDGGDAFVSRSGSSVLELWRRAGDGQFARAHRLRVQRVRDGSAVVKALAPDGRSLLVDDGDDGLSRFDLGTGEKLWSAACDCDHVRWLPGGRQLVVGSKLYDADSGQPLGALGLSLAVPLPDGKHVIGFDPRLAPEGGYRTGAVVNVETGQRVEEMALIRPATEIRMSKDGAVTAFSALSGHVEAWSALPAKRIKLLQEAGLNLQKLVPAARADWRKLEVQQLSMGPDGEHAVALFAAGPSADRCVMVLVRVVDGAAVFHCELPSRPHILPLLPVLAWMNWNQDVLWVCLPA